MPNPLSKLTRPWYPATALGLEKGMASVVEVDRGRGKGYTLRRAATVSLGESLIQPAFEESNIPDRSELAGVLFELASSAGLGRQKKWSVTLPGATTRTLILTLETRPGSQRELEEVLAWKMDRGFGVPLSELSVSRETLPKDSQGRDRYLVVATRIAVLAEYEDVFGSLGWRAGLILPRHLGEAQWLTGNGFKGDTLLVSSSEEGFTAMVFRDKQPIILRSILCEEEEREDEFFRLLLFYRDRRAADTAGASQMLSGMLVTGNGFSKGRASEIVNETLGGELRELRAEDLGLHLPSRDLSFDAIAAPAGLAALSL
ncbi:MAG TPA: hypothetical protein VEW46_08720 [Pyrinomonadaceae bacterium]|nr:hypothetical protein [Pyrinomonadaceae bacterium]